MNNLTHLTSLQIRGNQLTGHLPQNISFGGSLEALGAAENKFTGDIPKELGRMISLDKLSFSHNQFSEKIPIDIGSLDQLEQLELAANNLTGPIPKELGSLRKLWILNLSKNKFEFNMPVAEIAFTMQATEKYDFYSLPIRNLNGKTSRRAHCSLTGIPTSYDLPIKNMLDQDYVIISLWRLGFCGVLEAEGWGMLRGLEIAWQKGFHQVIVESDSEVLIRMLRGKMTKGSFIPPVFRRILQMLERSWNVRICKVDRKANACADALAKLGFGLELGCHMLEETPSALTDLVEKDEVARRAAEVSGHLPP
ncbi:putative leucine-rich repeat receptor-like serine/threonine-protein kinase At3g53590 [Neltuma alba]|uniref:putative leucine-rich repeat receptor-like serine/threonine-protein kinase At3g53590 n=1 Tax=Neltuma alba TaxID=207710 RepID=UPI0010A41A2C|nr:putative leucine-rich repeat receptor-like serine/threonine-protein kinase At3g53590 [Prosopis alba]